MKSNVTFQILNRHWARLEVSGRSVPVNLADLAGIRKVLPRIRRALKKEAGKP